MNKEHNQQSPQIMTSNTDFDVSLLQRASFPSSDEGKDDTLKLIATIGRIGVEACNGVIHAVICWFLEEE